jgi:hypothetical protein
MRIGFYVEGSTDEALLEGLRLRWCPDAEVAMAAFRGRARRSLRRDIEKSLMILCDARSSDVVVLLIDSDEARWQDVLRRESAHIPVQYQHRTVFGVAERNIECWLAADRDALAREIGCATEELAVEDPKGIVERGFGYRNAGVDVADVKARISEFVRNSSIRNWIRNSDSFARFYDDVRALAGQSRCQIPNEREAAE